LHKKAFAMTGYTVHTGSSVKFSEGWDRIFAGDVSAGTKKKSAAQQPAKSAKPKAKAPAAGNAAAKKTAAKRTSAGKVQSKRAALRSRSSGNS
jgi:hypothetical protein